MIPAVMALVSLIGCGKPAPAHSEPRWISLSPAITETVVALDGAEHLVARSEWCTAAPHLPAVGSALTPELERIATLHPTGILVDASRGTDPRALQAIAPVTTLPWLTVVDVAQSVRTLGDLLDRRDAARTLAADIAALDVAAPAAGPSVLLALTADPTSGDIWFVKRNSLHGVALHAAGAVNAVDRDIEGAPTLSVEALIALDPGTIVILTPAPVDAEHRATIVADWSRIAPLSAVKAGRIGVVGGPEALSTGPGILPTVENLKTELALLPPATP